MRAIIVFTLLNLTLIVFPQQLVPEWIQLENSSPYIGGGSIVRTDQSNNLYVLTGWSYPGWWDHGATVIKYSEEGELLWTNSFQVDTASISGFAVNQFGSSFIIFEESNFYFYGGIFATDSSGNEIFDYDFPNYIFQDVACDAYGNAYVTGLKKNGFNNWDLVLIKFDHVGNIQWEQTHDIPGMNTVGKAVVVNDSSIYVAGNCWIGNIALKYDLAANLESSCNFFEDPWGEYIYRSLHGAKDSQGNIYFFGRNEAMEGYIKHSFVYKFDPDLNKIWHDTTSLFDMILTDLSVNQEQQVFLCGYDYNLFQPIYMSYSHSGVKEWHHNIATNTGYFSSTAVSGESIFFTGYCYYPELNAEQMLIYRVNKQGDSISQFIYPQVTDTSSRGYDLIFDNNNQLVVIGVYENPSVHCMTIKFDQLTEIGESGHRFYNTPLVYPNPSKDVIYLDEVHFEGSEYQIFNIVGELIHKGILNESNAISIMHLKNGLYFLKTEMTVLKFVKK